MIIAKSYYYYYYYLFLDVMIGANLVMDQKKKIVLNVKKDLQIIYLMMAWNVKFARITLDFILLIGYANQNVEML